MQIINPYFEIEPKNSQFYSLGVEITHRCNMECANCYMPNREVPDFDVNRLYGVLEQLPKKTEIRLLGGEPTVRSDLPEIVAKIKSLGHRVTMMTNGLMLARPGYARELVDAGMRSIYLSLNGADDNDIYEKMDGIRCAERKLQAWQECHDANMNVNIGAILQKGTNDFVPKRLLELSNEMGGGHILRFRNVGQIGRYTLTKEQNWTWDEIVNNICEQYGVDPARAKSYNRVNGFSEENTILFPIDENKKLKGTWVKITDWSPSSGLHPDTTGNRRGRITQNFKLAPYFEHVKMYENVY